MIWYVIYDCSLNTKERKHHSTELYLMVPCACPLSTKKNENQKKKWSYDKMLIDWVRSDRTGNIWLSVRTHGPRARSERPDLDPNIFPSRITNSTALKQALHVNIMVFNNKVRRNWYMFCALWFSFKWYLVRSTDKTTNPVQFLFKSRKNTSAHTVIIVWFDIITLAITSNFRFNLLCVFMNSTIIDALI